MPDFARSDTFLQPPPSSKPLDAAKILVIESNPTRRRLFEVGLRQEGAADVIHATVEDDILSVLRRRAPDVVLLDMRDANPHSVSLLQTVRSRYSHDALPIVVHSSGDSEARRAQVFEAGATDLVGNKHSLTELVARLRYHVGHRRAIEDMRRFQVRLTEELERARELQQAFLPRPDQIEGFAARFQVTIDHVSRPSLEVGGDLWALIEAGDRQFGILMADFSGKGISSAMNTFRLSTLLGEMTADLKADPAAALSWLDRRLQAAEMLNREHAAAAYFLFDKARNELRFSGAALNPRPLLVRGADVIALQTDESALGFGIGEYETTVLPLRPGDGVFIQTDGMENAWLPDGTVFGMDRIRDRIMRSMASPAGRPARDVLAAVDAACPDGPDDDVTAVYLRWS